MSTFLICSLAVAFVIFFILFLFVFKARKKFQIVKQILTPITLKSKKTVYDFFVYHQNKGKFLDTQIFEGNTYCYYPKSNTVCTEENATKSNSLYDITATAHELGHATAQQKQSKLMSLWYALTTFEKLFCWAILPLFFIGFIFSFFPILQIAGTICLNLSSAFSIVILIGRVVTIPTEKEASRYGLELLDSAKILSDNEKKMSKKMLNIALSTYVFAFYERLFFNFILAKKIIYKIFKIKPKQKQSIKALKQQKEIKELIEIIENDNKLYSAPTEEEKLLEEAQKQIEEENMIKMPKLD